MKITESGLKDVYIIEPSLHGDSRGWFMESYRADEMKKAGIDTVFIQDNQSMSAQKGTLRGIHFQNFPYAQSKVVRCLKGEILDIAVDLRSWSPNYKKWVGVVLSEENKKQLFIPRGFGHAFLTLTKNSEVAYKVDEYYNAKYDRSINYSDKSIGIKWDDTPYILSEKDKNSPQLEDSDCNFGTKVLVTGVNGQLGYDVVKLLKKQGVECVGVDIDDFDLTDKNAVSAFIANYKPTVIIHCAAYTAVDKAEGDKEKCFCVNVTGTKNLALAAKKADAKFMYISTDYVYGGGGQIPFKENAGVNPLSVYGETKLQGEKEVISLIDKHFILRTSWVFGKNGNNFVKTMLKLAKEKEELNIVDDQIGSPTYTVDLAKLIVDMIFSDKYGIYNVSNENYCSWNEFALEIFKLTNSKVKVTAVTSAQYPQKAKRPLNSRLDKSKLVENGFERLPVWQDALKRYLEEIT